MRKTIVSNYELNDADYSIVHEVARGNEQTHSARPFSDAFYLIYFLKGSAYLKTAKQLVALEEHDLVVIPKNKKFSFIASNDEDSEYFLISTKEELVDKVLAENFSEQVEIINLANYDIARLCFDRLNYYEKNKEKIDEVYFSKLLHFLVAEIYINLTFIKTSDIPAEDLAHNPFLTRLISYINSHLQTVSVKNLASNFKVSTTYIYKVLKKTMGVSPKEYITNKRLSYAKFLIDNGETAWNTAFQCGYNDYSSFYRAYCKFFNTTPSETPPPPKNSQE